MADDFICARIALVVEIGLIVLNSLDVEESLEYVRELALPEVQIWMVVLAVIVEQLGVTHHFLSAVVVVLEEKAASWLSIELLDHEGAGPVAIQLPLCGCGGVLGAISAPVLFHYGHGSVSFLSSQKVVFGVGACIYSEEPNSICRTARIAISRKRSILDQKLAAEEGTLVLAGVYEMPNACINRLIPACNICDQEHCLERVECTFSGFILLSLWDFCFLLQRGIPHEFSHCVHASPQSIVIADASFPNVTNKGRV